MKTLFIALVMTMAASTMGTSIYDFKIQALDSDEVIDLKSFEGKKILIVNVASKCGYTPQYKDLQTLYEQYSDRLVILGFPCNQFFGQEPGSESQIQQFCTATYGVTFPMTTKVDVKGKDQHPIYKWLTHKELNGKDDYKVSWNFNKFLIDKNGQLMAHFGSRVNPLDEEIISLLE